MPKMSSVICDVITLLFLFVLGIVYSNVAIHTDASSVLNLAAWFSEKKGLSFGLIDIRSLLLCILVLSIALIGEGLQCQNNMSEWKIECGANGPGAQWSCNLKSP